MSLLQFTFTLLFFAGPTTANTELARVNEQRITENDLEVLLRLRGQTGTITPAARETVTQELIDRELVRQFLRRRKTEADADALSRAIRSIKQRFRHEADQQREVHSAIDESRLRSEVALNLAWDRHARRVITEARIRDFFAEHRRRLDGTRLRVSQIFINYEQGESAKRAEKTLQRMSDIRKEITSGGVSFADAARKASAAPSAGVGGDIGLISPLGDLPKPVTTAAFQLDVGMISDAITSQFGIHLITVTEVHEGELSLEDVRPQIMQELSQELWKETVAAEKGRAIIELN